MSAWRPLASPRATANTSWVREGGRSLFDSSSCFGHFFGNSEKDSNQINALDTYECAAVERREAGVPIARGERRLASVSTCLASTSWVPRKHPASLGAPLPLARPHVAKEEGKRFNQYGGAAGAAKQTAGEAMAIRGQMTDDGRELRAKPCILCPLIASLMHAR